MGWSKVVDSKDKHWIALVTVRFDSLFLWERVGERAWRTLQTQTLVRASARRLLRESSQHKQGVKELMVARHDTGLKPGDYSGIAALSPLPDPLPKRRGSQI